MAIGTTMWWRHRPSVGDAVAAAESAARIADAAGG